MRSKSIDKNTQRCLLMEGIKVVPNKSPSNEITGISNEYSGDEFFQIFYRTKVNVFLYLKVSVLLSN